MTTPDPFPDELVEAAAKAAMEAEPGQNWECATAKEADVYLRDSLAVLAAVLPRIEQRVIDRLAREAGENPYAGDTVCWCPDDWREPFDKARCPQHGGAAYESERSKFWREGAARGVAAGRTRWEPLVRDLIDPGECRYDHHGYCQEHGWMTTEPPCPHARAKAALSGEEGDA